jgi:hypothetical protein
MRDEANARVSAGIEFDQNLAIRSDRLKVTTHVPPTGRLLAASARTLVSAKLTPKIKLIAAAWHAHGPRPKKVPSLWIEVCESIFAISA